MRVTIGLLDDIAIELTCPQRIHKFNVKLHQAHRETTVICPGCNRQIRLKKEGDEPGKNNTAYSNLMKTLRDINKKLKL